MKLSLFLSLLSVAVLWSQASWANCPVTLTVTEKREIVALSHGGNPPAIHTVVLKPEKSIGASEECTAYLRVEEFHMNNVGREHQAFQELKVGDVVKGTLNYHRPSPHGKHLHDNYHHGFRLLKSSDEDYSQQYVYFRHIGLY